MEDRVKTKNYKLILPQNDEFYDVEDFNKNAEAIDELISNINNVIGYTNSIYGVEMDFESMEIKRLAGAVDADFDRIPIFARRRCVLGDDGKVIVYEGDDGYDESGTVQITTVDDMGVSYTGTFKGQIMVEDVPFYYRVIPQKLERLSDGSVAIKKMSIFVSEQNYENFKLHPYFKSGTSCNYRAVFPASRADTSLDGDISLDEKLASVSNGGEIVRSDSSFIESTGESSTLNALDAFITMSSNRGKGWTLISEAAVEATLILYLIEYATFDFSSNEYRGEIFDDAYFCTSGMMMDISLKSSGYILNYLNAKLTISERAINKTSTGSDSGSSSVLLQSVNGNGISSSNIYSADAEGNMFSMVACLSDEETFTNSRYNVAKPSGKFNMTRSYYFLHKPMFDLCMYTTSNKVADSDKEEYKHSTRIMYVPDVEDAYDGSDDVTLLQYGNDLDDVIKAGKYQLMSSVATALYYPNAASDGGGLLEVIVDKYSNIVQRFTEYSTAKVYVRTYEAMVWTEWLCLNDNRSYEINLPTGEDFSRSNEYLPYTAEVEVTGILKNDYFVAIPQYTTVKTSDEMGLELGMNAIQSMRELRELEKNAYNCVTAIKSEDGKLVVECDDEVPLNSVKIKIVVIGKDVSK